MASSILRDELDYNMSEGQSKRARECDQCLGQGNSMAVQITRKEDGFLWTCFRCKMAGLPKYCGFFHDEGASPSEVKKMEARAKKADNRPEVIALPEDFTTTLPPKAAVQLYNLELDPDDITRYDIGWSQGHGRIIVPVYQYGSGQSKELVGVVGRKLDSDPKEKSKWWFARQKNVKHLRYVVPSEASSNRKQVVVVENCFSAIKCTKAVGTTNSIALITSYFPTDLMNVLTGWKVFIWLDADAYDKACRYQAMLGNKGITSHVVLTDNKPKDCTLDEIKEQLIWPT